MYTEFYGFSEKPFNVTPNPKFLFFTDSHREALSSMIYGITERKGFIAITGEVGTGKTTLVHHLLQTLNKKTKTVFIYQTHISFAGLLKNILLELEIRPEENDIASLIRQLNEYLVQRLVVDENLAVLIDEAQNLGNEVLEDLRMLSNLETPNFKLIQIIFLGQPEFDGKLNSPDMRQLKQRIAIRRQLRPLTERATRQYIDHRLKIAGSSSSQVFSSGALALITRCADGIPRNINMICDNSFLIGYSLSRKKIDEKIIREVLKDLGMDNAGRIPQTLEQCKDFGKSEAFEPLESSPEQATSDAKPETPDPGQPILAFGPSILESRQRVVISAVRPQPLRPQPSKKKNRAWAAIAILAVLGLGVFFEKDYIYNVGHKWVGNSLAGQALAPVPAPFVKVSIKANPEGVKPPAEAKIDVPQATVPAVPPTPEEKTEPSQSLGPRPVAKAPEPAPKPENHRKVIAVKAGDTIYALSRKYLHLSNITLVDMILELNPKITNPHLIKINQRVKLPEISPDALIIESPDGARKVLLGTFPTLDAAEEFKSIPFLRGKEIEVISRKISPEETWYRLFAGPFASKEEGLKAIQELREKRLLPALKERT